MSKPFVCPVCDEMSLNTDPGAHSYCSNCRGYTELEPPEGFQWALLCCSDGKKFGRLFEIHRLYPGRRYEIIGEGMVFIYNGSQFNQVTRAKGETT